MTSSGAWRRSAWVGILERLLLVALGVALETAAMPPGPAPVLAFAADAPFLWLLFVRGGRAWWLWAFLYGFVRFAVGIRWLAEVHPLEVAGAAFILAFTQWTYGAGVRWAARRRAPFLLAAPLAAVLAEMLQTAVVVQSGMPWPARSLAFTAWEGLLGSASVLGAYGLTFLAVLGSAWVSGLPALLRRSPWRGRHAGELAGKGAAVAAVVLVAAWHGAGVVAGAQARIASGETVTTAPLVVIQANIPQRMKVDAREGSPDADDDPRRTIFERHLALTTTALEANRGALAVLWPETMVPYEFLSPDLAERFPLDWESETNVIGRLKAAVPPGANARFLLGVNHYFVGRKGPRETLLEHDCHDSVVFVNADQATDIPPVVPEGVRDWKPPWEIRPGRYDKRILVPGGEYTPLGDWIPALREFKERVSSIPEITPGDPDPEPFLLALEPPDRARGRTKNREVRAGTVICFEIAFPGCCRAWRAAGADVLLNAGNYGWYGDTGMPAQVQAIARLRAAELAVTVVVAGNTGPTCIVDPGGRVRTRVEVGGRTQFVEGWCAGPVYADDEVTPYARWGDAPWLFAAALGILWIGLRRGRGRRPTEGGTPGEVPPEGGTDATVKSEPG